MRILIIAAALIGAPLSANTQPRLTFPPGGLAPCSPPGCAGTDYGNKAKLDSLSELGDEVQMQVDKA